MTFRVKNKMIRKWNPYTGEISMIHCFSENKDGINVPLNLAPYESLFLVFSPGEPETYVTKTGFNQIRDVTKNEISADVLQNGTFVTSLISGNVRRKITSVVSGIPAPYHISGKWAIELKGDEFPLYTRQSDDLFSWTDDSLTRNFSGTGGTK